jgi:hypothetical protein
VTREPVSTEGHSSTWLWHWVCDRIGCKTQDPTTTLKRGLPSPEDMQARGWFVAQKWGDRCPACVAAGEIPDVEPWRTRTVPPMTTFTTPPDGNA